MGACCATRRRPPKPSSTTTAGAEGGGPGKNGTATDFEESIEPMDPWESLDAFVKSNDMKKHSAFFTEIHITQLDSGDYSVFPTGGNLSIQKPKVFSFDSLKNDFLWKVGCETVHVWNVRKYANLEAIVKLLCEHWQGLGPLKHLLIHRFEDFSEIEKLGDELDLHANTEDNETVSLEKRQNESVVRFKVPKDLNIDQTKISSDWQNLRTGRGAGSGVLETPTIIIRRKKPGEIGVNFQTSMSTEMVTGLDKLPKTLSKVKCHCVVFLCCKFDTATILKILSSLPECSVIRFIGENPALDFQKILKKIAEYKPQMAESFPEVILEDVQDKQSLTTSMVDFLDVHDLSVTEIRYVMEDGEKVRLTKSIGMQQGPNPDDVTVEYIIRY